MGRSYRCDDPRICLLCFDVMCSFHCVHPSQAVKLFPHIETEEAAGQTSQKNIGSASLID